jgi:hypothetical protein
MPKVRTKRKKDASGRKPVGRTPAVQQRHSGARRFGLPTVQNQSKARHGVVKHGRLLPEVWTPLESTMLSTLDRRRFRNMPKDSIGGSFQHLDREGKVVTEALRAAGYSYYWVAGLEDENYPSQDAGSGPYFYTNDSASGVWHTDTNSEGNDMTGSSHALTVLVCVEGELTLQLSTICGTLDFTGNRDVAKDTISISLSPGDYVVFHANRQHRVTSTCYRMIFNAMIYPNK